MDNDLAGYYARRAQEYEAVYEKPERKRDLAALDRYLREAFSNRHVLEIACGTGYWTQRISRAAASIQATDIGVEILREARKKEFSCPVTVTLADAFALDTFPPTFDALFGGFIWSHIPRRQLRPFLESVCSRLAPGGMGIFIDNIYREGSSTPVSDRNREGDTYQVRTLNNGEQHRVLKNFPSDDELTEALKPFGTPEAPLRLTYYWIVRFRRAGAVTR